jgi:hypothetical protein
VQDKATVNTELQELSNHINTSSRAAQRAKRNSRCLVDVVIFSFREDGFLVCIPHLR